MMPSDFNIVTSRKSFFENLDRAIDQTRIYMQNNPQWDLLQSFSKQLEAMKQWTLNGRKPPFDERKTITIGTQALRELQNTPDLEWYDYMQLLSELDLYFKYWRSDRGLDTLDEDDWRTDFPGDYDLSDE